MSLLAVRGLSKAFGGLTALDEVSFEVEAGSMVAMIGPNGAGKTTCFNILTGQLRPDRGSVMLEGAPITSLAPRAIALLGVGRTFQTAAVFGSLTVLENVLVGNLAVGNGWKNGLASASDMDPTAAHGLLASVGLADAEDRAASTLAYGAVKRLELAIALAAHPKLLLMDEPTAGMAADERASLMQLVRGLVKAKGTGVLFTEHSMDAVFGFADDLLVLERGKLIAHGLPSTVRDDPAVRAAYLGYSDR